MVERSLEFWVIVTFPDESQFSLISDTGGVLVRRLNNHELDIKRLQPTVTNCGYSVMAWGPIWSDVCSELVECQGNITSVKNVSILLEGILPIFSSGKMIKNESLFMEDGPTCFIAKNTQY